MATSRLEEVVLRLHDSDHVGVAKQFLRAGTKLATRAGEIEARQNIPAGHKIALEPVAPESPIRKYGQIIGFARHAILPGDHVHTHNVFIREFNRNTSHATERAPWTLYEPERMRYFPGYARPGGRVGTRNYVAVISSVNCSASVSQAIASAFRNDAFRREFPGIDGVIAFTHKGGCALDPSEPLQILQRVLAGVARHPNIGGYVMVGLGCEVNQLSTLRQAQKLDELRPGEIPPEFMTIQHLGGIRKTVAAGVAAVTRVLPRVNAMTRSPQPLSKLMLAENCGGSDGNSGITANPALGVASDELVRYGGTSVLAETPEIYGAEHLLTSRAINRGVSEQLLAHVRWWEDHARQHGASIDNNPSVGNKEGGLTTIYEKSLGAVAKGGQAPLMAVYRYADPIDSAGFCFMDTPGYDPVSMTGLVCGGCNVGVFTTGRGSVYGCKPVPCLKVATHSALFRHMEEDMDINAGTILDGAESLAEVGRHIFEKIVAVAGGERTKSELAGVGDEEFAPWMLGPTF